LAGCVVYTEGGYGHWALLISGGMKGAKNHNLSSSESCAINAQFARRTRAFKTECKWKDHDHNGHEDVTAALVEQTAPLFLEPMS